MEWVEDSGLAKRIVEAVGSELQKDQSQYLERMPHLSELIYCLTASWYNRFNPMARTEREMMLFSTGIGLEQVMLRPHKLPRTGELDGVYWSADFLDFVEGLGEMKSTRISQKNLPEKLPIGWLRQMLSYMKATGNNEVSLVVMHLMGDYKPPFPTLRALHGMATQQEIDDNWRWVLERKEIYLHHAEIETPPLQFRYNEDYECENCRYLIICQANESIDQLRLLKGESK